MNQELERTSTFVSEPIIETIKTSIQKDDVIRLKELLTEETVKGFGQDEMYDLVIEAVMDEKPETLEYLLASLTKHGRTLETCEPILVLALMLGRSDAFVAKLLNSSYDVTQRDFQSRTPLHHAVQRESSEIAKLLIEKGADVDAKDCDRYTPLHYAVQTFNTDAVCMLLYYKASANEVSLTTKMTPFMVSLCMEKAEVQEVLIDYVTDFNQANANGFSTAYLALKHRSPFCGEIFSRGAEIEDCIDLLFSGVEIFDVTWPLITRNILSRQRIPILKKFFLTCFYPPHIFLHYLHALLSWKHVDFAVEQYLKSANKFQCSIFADFAQTTQMFVIKPTWRLEIVWLLLSLGVPVYTNDIYHIYKCFGFGEELDALMVANSEVVADNFYHVFPHFLNYVCFNSTEISTNFRCDTENISDVLHFLKFYTPSRGFKEKLLSAAVLPFDVPDPPLSIKKATQLRRVPSLLELTRNVTRDVIFSNYRHDSRIFNSYSVMRSLPVTKFIKKVLILKHPLYSLKDL